MGYVENVGIKSGTKEYMVPDPMKNSRIAASADTLASSKTENAASAGEYATIAAEKIGHVKNWKNMVQAAKCYVPSAQSVDFTSKGKTFLYQFNIISTKKVEENAKLFSNLSAPCSLLLIRKKVST
jgi:hypothetical protein